MHSRGRGMKRRRSSFLSENEDTKITGKLFHGMKEVKKAAKKAKVFEARKIVKKLKESLGKKNTEKLALETELDALKAIDHNRIGALALKSKLNKDKVLSNEPFVQTALSTYFPPDLTFPPEGTANKLKSRLLSSKTLSGAVSEVISSLHSTLKSVDDGGNDVAEESGRLRKLQDVNLPVVEESSTTLEASEGSSRHSTPLTAGTGDEPAEAEGDTSSNDDSTTSIGPFSPIATLFSSRSYSSSSDQASPTPHVGSVPKTPGANSIFLPTLSNGFIPGGSDTDWSDGEARTGGDIRKNRRGQRARRAIWEKKYGRKAKHLQKQVDSGATHGRRILRKHVQGTQAVSNSRPAGSSRQHGRANKREEVSNDHVPHKPRAKRVDDGTLHPSWEAKRRMKERSSAAIVPSQGKRVTFDD